MGRVYKVYDTEIKEKVALKLLKPEIAADQETIERFRNELKLARKISHHNICRMHDISKEEGAYYITMEYISGEDLKSMIRMSGTMSVGAVLSIGKQTSPGYGVRGEGRALSRIDVKNKEVACYLFLLEGMIFVRLAGFFWPRFSP